MLEPEDLTWKNNTALRGMMDSYNAFVDEVARMSAEVDELSAKAAQQREEYDAQLHTLNDTILNVNFKVDQVKNELNDKLDDILRTVKRYHPNI